MKTTYKTIPQKHMFLVIHVIHISTLSVQKITKAGADPYATFGVRKICVRVSRPGRVAPKAAGKWQKRPGYADFVFEKQ